MVTGEDGKTWLASRYILEAELTEFAARLAVNVTESDLKEDIEV